MGAKRKTAITSPSTGNLHLGKQKTKEISSGRSVLDSLSTGGKSSGTPQFHTPASTPSKSHASTKLHDAEGLQVAKSSPRNSDAISPQHGKAKKRGGSAKASTKLSGSTVEEEVEKTADLSQEMILCEDAIALEGSQAPSKKITPSMRVLARWRDGYYYPSTVQGADGDDRWKILFDDGNCRTISENNLLAVALLAEGQSVLAKSSSDGFYDSGIVRGHYRQGSDVGYIVERDDSVTMRYPRHMVILSSDQAACLLPNSPPPASSSAISLDNVVDGKRRRGPLHSPAANPPAQITSTSSRRKKKPDPIFDSTDSASRDSGDKTPKRGQISVSSPRTEHAKRGQRSSKARKKLQEDSSEDGESYVLQVVKGSSRSGGHVQGLSPCTGIEVDMTCTSDSEEKNPPTPSKRRGKFQAKSEMQEKTSDKSLATSLTSRSRRTKATSTSNMLLGCVPSSGSTLFQNFAFLLSCAERKARQPPRRLVPTSDSSESESQRKEDKDNIPFDKDYLRKQIEAGGGTVLDSFEASQTMSGKQVLLLANDYLRTLTYIQCLAAGIPCIAHTWIKDCCRENAIQNYEVYRLPAGYSYIEERVLEWHGDDSVLKGKQVLLVAPDNKDFVSTWTLVLMAARAEVVRRLPSDSAKIGSALAVDVVVTDDSCPPTVLSLAQRFDIPVVSSEWIVQCLISGCTLLASAHERFRHDFGD